MNEFRMKGFESTDKNYKFLFECDDRMDHDYRVILQSSNGSIHQFVSSNKKELLLAFEKDRTQEGRLYQLQILEYGKIIYTKQIYLKTRVQQNNSGIVKKDEPKKEMVEKKEEKSVFDYTIDEMAIVSKIKELFKVEEM